MSDTLILQPGAEAAAVGVNIRTTSDATIATDERTNWTTTLSLLKRKSYRLSKDSTLTPSTFTFRHDDSAEKARPDTATAASQSLRAESPSTISKPFRHSINNFYHSSSSASKGSRKERRNYPKQSKPDRPISIDDPSIFACFMASSASDVLRVVMPRLPLVGKTLAWHTLGFSQTSPYWDLRTEITVAMVRSLVSKHIPDPVTKSQQISLRDLGVRGRMWIANVPIPAPTGPETRQHVIDAVLSLVPEDDREGFEWTPPSLPAASGEWTGYRAGVAMDAPPPPDMSEADKYAAMMKEVTSPVTIYYIHGGAMYLMDPATHRPTCARLAKEAKGRLFSLRYRLAPQNPFPAALMDAFLGYLYLLYPPAGALHEPVDPNTLVITGDSAGGNLTAALTALILTLRRSHPDGKIMHEGQLVDLPLPAGIALNSPWLDVTHSFPSVIANRKFDYLPSPLLHAPTGIASFPNCPAWPTSPPRKLIYMADNMTFHPLVSPAAFADWTGCPPVLVMCGQELLQDESHYFAAHLKRQGVVVQLEMYQAMPHCFAQVMDWLPVTGKCFATWAKFLGEAVEGAQGEDGKGPVPNATKVLAKSLKEVDIGFDNLSRFEHGDVVVRMRKMVEQGVDFHMGRAGKL